MLNALNVDVIVKPTTDNTYTAAVSQTIQQNIIYYDVNM